MRKVRQTLVAEPSVARILGPINRRRPPDTREHRSEPSDPANYILALSYDCVQQNGKWAGDEQLGSMRESRQRAAVLSNDQPLRSLVVKILSQLCADARVR